MRVLIGGSSGLVGTALQESLRSDSHSVVRLVRRNARDESEREWRPPARPSGDLDGFDAVVHLGGRSIGVWPWTSERKREFRSSRIDSTDALARAIAAAPRPPRVFVVASAVGYYGSRGDEPLDEVSSAGDDFLARLVVDWEAAAQPARDAGIRTVHVRLGLVLSADGGPLPAMLPPFRLGLGARLGDGRQWMSWVTRSDVVRAIRFALESEAVEGPVNVVADAATNAQFTRTLAGAVGRPAPFAAPAWLLRGVGGEMARSTVLASQRAESNALRRAGFTFEEPELGPALSRRTDRRCT